MNKQPLKLEVGKKYRTREGQIIQISDVVNTSYPGAYSHKGYVDSDASIMLWTPNGKYNISELEHPLDLIEEIVEEKTTTSEPTEEELYGSFVGEGHIESATEGRANNEVADRFRNKIAILIANHISNGMEQLGYSRDQETLVFDLLTDALEARSDGDLLSLVIPEGSSIDNTDGGGCCNE